FVTGINTVCLTATNTYSGLTNISNGGTVVIDNDARLGNAANSLFIDSGTLRLNNGAGYNTNRTVLLGSNGGTIDTTAISQPVGFNNIISGAGGLTKTGPGRIGLLAANTYSGPTNVLAGFLDVGHNQALQNSTATLSGGAIGFVSPAN